MSQVQIPNSDHVFDELELIIFVSQGLTLSTASLVIIYFDGVSSSKQNLPSHINNVEHSHKIIEVCVRNNNVDWFIWRLVVWQQGG